MHTKGKMYVPSLWMEERYAGNGRKKNPKNVWSLIWDSDLSVPTCELLADNHTLVGPGAVHVETHL